MKRLGILMIAILMGIIGVEGNNNQEEVKEEAVQLIETMAEEETVEELPELEQPIEAEEKFEEIETISVESDMPYYIRINRQQNVVNIYERVDKGMYEPYRAMLCSIGKATPASGKSYQTTNLKHRWSLLKGNVYGQYTTQIVGGIWFHSVPYTKENAGALEYWEYDKLGTEASLGCIRLTVENAKWVYENIEAGTTVEFYEEENPGPFRKTYCRKDIGK